MSGQLFGDIELGKSFGISHSIKLKFSKARVLLYASGNCLNAVDLNSSKEFKNENGSAIEEKKDKKDGEISLLGACHGDAHSKVLVGDGQLSSFATFSKDNIIGYSEMYSNSIKIVRWTSTSGVVTPIAKLQVTGDLSIIALAFSADGLYLAALGDLPGHQITIWDWRAQKHIISVPNGSPAEFLSFNPLDSKQLCTSGKNGQIRFWNLKIGFKKYTMTSISGAKSPFDSFEEANKIQLNPWQLDVGEKENTEMRLPTPYQHMWIPDKKVLSISKDGTQIYKYNSEKGLYEIFIEAGPDQKFLCILQTSKNFYVAEKGGYIGVLNLQGDYLRSIKIPENAEIVALESSPDYQRLLVEVEGGKYFLCDLKRMQSISIQTENVCDLADLVMLSNEKTMISAHTNGTLSFWVPEKSIAYQKMTIKSKISCLGVSHKSSVLAVGSSTGVVRLYNAKDITYHAPKLLFRKRIHKGPILKFAVDNTGTVLASAAQDGVVFLYNLETCQLIGYIKFQGVFKNMRWEICEEAGHSTRLYILQSDFGDSNLSQVVAFDLPDKSKIEVGENMQILRNLEPADVSHTFLFNGKINDFLVSPKPTMSSKNIFYALGADGHIKVFTCPSYVGGLSEKSTLNIPIQDFKDHAGHSAHFTANSNGEWILTSGSEGLITVRSVIEPEKALKINAHNGALGGVYSSIFSYNYRHILSMGNDGLVRRWDWKYSPSSRKAAAELADTIEKEGLEQNEAINPLDAMTEVVDTDDLEQENSFLSVGSGGETAKANLETLDEAKEQFKLQIQQKVIAITQRTLSLMQMNDEAPDLEKIDRSEFVIDLLERERLNQETDNMIALIRKEQERKNMEKRVLRDRMKKECWDSCEVVGQSIKSFKPNVMLGKQLEVTNYPIRKLSKEEHLRISNVKRLRRVQLAVYQAFQKNSEAEKPSEVTEEPNVDAPAVSTIENKTNYGETAHTSLLYNPFELNSKERRRIQSYILSENIQEIKASFNKTFHDMFKSKQDEISKIEEKNERIASILNQLQMNEKIYKPELDDDEVPENIIKVHDSEVKAEKFLNAEELAKLEARKLQAEERLRLQGEDNFRQRALIDMMNGKLEDRKAQEDKEEIVRPDWMNKPKDEMSDDEKKFLKEFEKKMAIFKEEQEKHRKALETELRKLQAGISDIQDAFDQKLVDFFQFKLDIDSIIYQKELSMIKQTQFAITAHNDDNLETKLLDRIDALKQEKIDCTNEIPEIKKELERCREEHDIAIKKDKELEKQFKKEFHVHEMYFEALNRLFKRRSQVSGENKDSGAAPAPVEDDLNPFATAEKEFVSLDSTPVSLNQATDMPDGLSLDVWNKLVEIRDKKILLELDVYTTGRSLKETQALVQNVLDESDTIKSEMEKTINDLNQFLEYKFKNVYDLECLFEFKQGQVEVPQAPIVTNYTDAVLVHRSVVENLNEQVRHLGQLKVEALTEMKDYRKGIHALEWENKMHDFQAEDMIIRSRDIQLLRVTKEMQEYLRNGDNHKQASEVSNLEKISEHAQKAHLHHLQEKQNTIDKIKLKRRKKMKENENMKTQIQNLSQSVQERYKVQEAKLSRKPEKTKQDVHKELFTRRRLVDLAKSQAQDIAILREELERLRLRTYPAFRTN